MAVNTRGRDRVHVPVTPRVTENRSMRNLISETQREGNYYFVLVTNAGIIRYY